MSEASITPIGNNHDKFTSLPGGFRPDGDKTAKTASYTEDTTLTRDTHQKVTGHNTHVDEKSTSQVMLTGDFDNRVLELVNGAIKNRQAVEDERAIHRNRNRILILLVVLAMELIVPTLYGWHILPAIFVKYEVLAITAPDALLTVYAYVKRY
jgi:hypothetical protein